MRINYLAASALIFFISSTVGQAQSPDPDKVNDLAAAISRAEGFGIRGTIPNRYHNPGDLKAHPDSLPLTGQVRIGKAGHIVFKNDEAGKAALRDCILRMMDGRSSHFHPDMTLNQVARKYAQNWRPWVKIVSAELGVPPTTTLRAYLNIRVPPPAAPEPASFRPLPDAKPAPLSPPVVTLAQSRRVLDPVFDIPVRVPPLVEDAPQRHKLQFLQRRRGER